LATAGFSMIGTFLLVKAVDSIFGLRVPDYEELVGLDLTQHGEAGYHM
jgi:Amt family ammonium transporter